MCQHARHRKTGRSLTAASKSAAVGYLPSSCWAQRIPITHSDAVWAAAWAASRACISATDLQPGRHARTRKLSLALSVGASQMGGGAGRFGRGRVAGMAARMPRADRTAEVDEEGGLAERVHMEVRVMQPREHLYTCVCAPHM